MNEFSDHQLASLADRIYAFTFDLLLLALAYFFLPGLLNLWFGQYTWVPVIVIVIFGLVYDPLLTSYYGCTIGHKICGLRVIDERGGHISLAKAFARYILKAFLGWATFLTYINSKRAFHDFATKTVVIKSRK